MIKNVKIAIRLDFLKVRRFPFPVPVVLPQKTKKSPVHVSRSIRIF